MAAHGANTSVLYIGTALKRYFAESFFADITHREFKNPGGGIQTPIKAAGQQFQILDIQGGALQTYSGADLTSTEPTEVRSILSIDQTRAVHEIIKDINVFKSQVKDPKSSVVEQLKDNLKMFTEAYVLTMWSDAAAGQWIGTDYTTGTVAIAATTGVVTGTSTVFTVAMVGKPFRAAGHTKWFRVATFTSTTVISIIDDSDDEAAVYTGGVISAGATYTIQANTALAITGSNIYTALFVAADIMLNKANVPTSNRYIILPHDAKLAVMSSAKTNSTLIEVVDESVVKGSLYKDMVTGFKVYFTNNLAGNNTTGWNVIAGQMGFIGAGFGMVTDLTEVDAQQNFGKIVKCLFACGAKVADGRRKFGVHALTTYAA